MISLRTAAFTIPIVLVTTLAAAQTIVGSHGRVAGEAGWNALREGRHDDAARAFAAAVDAEPRDPSLHLGAGLTAFLLGQPSAARHALERALELAPSLTPASRLLAEILYRGSDLAGAIRVYEAAQRYAPGDTSLATRVDALRREGAAHDAFYSSPGAHFTVLFEGPADEALASRAIEILEAAYWRVSTALGIYPEQVITVVLYTEQQFRDITRSPQWAAAAYDGRIRVPVRGTGADSRELERVLVHEFTHALVQTVAPRGVPMWLHEGLAVTFEPDGASWSDAQLTSSDVRLSLAQLNGTFGGLSGTEARLAYAQSAAIVRRLVEQAGAMAIGAVLQDIARGETFAGAFERHFLSTYDAFVASLEAPIDLLR